MTKGLLIGAAVVGGVFVGFVTYEIVKKKSPELLATARKKASNIGKRSSEIIAEARQAFAKGYASAQAKAPA